MDIHGTLLNARLLLKGDPRCPCLAGDVYGDTKGRFRDGDRITTSRLKAHDDGGIFRLGGHRHRSRALRRGSHSRTGRMPIAPDPWRLAFASSALLILSILAMRFLY